MQVIKKDLRTYTNADGTQRPMWYYLVHYMVRVVILRGSSFHCNDLLRLCAIGCAQVCANV